MKKVKFLSYMAGLTLGLMLGCSVVVFEKSGDPLVATLTLYFTAWIAIFTISDVWDLLR